MSSAVGQGGAGSLSGAACVRPSVLDESLIREQTKVDHFWGELAAVGVSGCLGEGGSPGPGCPSAPYRVGGAPRRFQAFLQTQIQNAGSGFPLPLLLAALTWNRLL